MLQRQWMAAAQCALLTAVLFSISAMAQEGAPWKESASAEPSGLVTTRLSGKELARWKAIETIALAVDANHQPLHPTLWGMWQWIETSGHTVYVEVTRNARVATCTAGNFIIERSDPRGERHIGAIKLNLSNIDLAYVGPNVARADGFVPFEKLNREERYVEVLGHELSHAVHILTSIDRTKLVEESVEKTNELLLKFQPRRKSEFIPADLKRRLSRRDELLESLERQAEAMEVLVWKELVASKAARAKAAAAVAP
ncbi:MAG: hypothetical protein SF339_11010 [Blastocatellia bacterium]|nr:hypothetical protein [Blastocatellia bacterium]